jgi:hypothetical protein
MGQTIYLELEGKREELSADTFLAAAREFLSLLREVDTALFQKPRGLVYWTIGSLNKQSPAAIGLVGRLKERHISDVGILSVKEVRDLMTACIMAYQQHLRLTRMPDGTVRD